MKKTTASKVPPGPEAPAVATRRHGPEKEKTQVTVRLDKKLMDRTYAEIKSGNLRITDVIEQGLVLALKEMDQDLPRVAIQVRFLVANTTKAQQVQLRRFLAFLVMQEVRTLSEAERRIRDFVLGYLESIEQDWPEFYDESVPLYSRYHERVSGEGSQLTGS